MVLRRHATAVPTDTPDHRFLGGLGRRTDRARQEGLMESHLSQACPSSFKGSTVVIFTWPDANDEGQCSLITEVGMP